MDLSRNVTHDTILGGAVILEQPERGYRFTSDALLLAASASLQEPATFIDAGAGCGVVGIALAHLVPDARGIAIEQNARLASHARNNASHYGDRVAVLEGDLRTIAPTLVSQVDAVVMNPPYFPPGHGRLNPDPQRAAARHQLNGTIDELIQVLSPCIKQGGSFEVIYAAAPFESLRRALVSAGFPRLTLRWVHPHKESVANTVIVSARRGQYVAYEILPPWFLRKPNGVQTSCIDRIMAGYRPLSCDPPT